MHKTRIFLAATLSLATSASGPTSNASTTTANTQETSPTSIASPKIPVAARTCAHAALKSKARAWVCLGNTLHIQVDRNGKIRNSKQRVNSSQSVTRETIAPAGSRPAATWPDSNNWCEPWGICVRIITDFIAVVKGNAMYGDQDEIIGNIDIETRTSLNGRSMRWQQYIGRESGPGIIVRQIMIHCREDRNAWPDPNCGDHLAMTYTGKVISSFKRTGYIQGNKLTSSNQYYSKTDGTFRSVGKTQQFKIAELQSAMADCWNSDPCYFD